MKSYISDIYDYYIFNDNDNIYEVNLTTEELDNAIYKYIINSKDLSFYELIELYKIIIYKQYNNIYKKICSNIEVILYIFQGLIIKLDDDIYNNMTIFILDNTSNSDLILLLYNSIIYIDILLIDILYDNKPIILYQLLNIINDRERKKLIKLLLKSKQVTNNCLLYNIISKTNYKLDEINDEIKTYINIYEILYKKINFTLTKYELMNIISNFILYHNKYKLYMLYNDYNNDKIIKYDLFHDMVNSLLNKYKLDYKDIQIISKNLDHDLLVLFLNLSTDLQLKKYIIENIDVDYHCITNKIIICKYSINNVNLISLILYIIEPVCLLDNWKLRIKLVNTLIEFVKTKKHKDILIKKIIVLTSINKDLYLLDYLIHNFNIEELGSDFLYFHVKHNFDITIPLVKSTIYLTGISDKFNL
jgi:hypothetical protein